jgi:hypothetical protein
MEKPKFFDLEKLTVFLSAGNCRGFTLSQPQAYVPRKNKFIRPTGDMVAPQETQLYFLSSDKNGLFHTIFPVPDSYIYFQRGIYGESEGTIQGGYYESLYVRIKETLNLPTGILPSSSLKCALFADNMIHSPQRKDHRKIPFWSLRRNYSAVIPNEILIREDLLPLLGMK